MANRKTKTDDTVADQGAFIVSYFENGEPVVLSYHDAERRDHEATRIRGMGFAVDIRDAE